MADVLRVLQAASFARVIKKLTVSDKAALDAAVQRLLKNPLLGELKVGDLAGVRVLKFSMNRQQTLLAYEWLESELVLYLLKLGSHENFYRDLKGMK